MQHLSVVLVFIALACSAVTAAHVRGMELEHFHAFKKQFGRRYATAAEESHRFEIFQQNMDRARRLQMANPLARFGPNQYSDVSAEEFKQRHNGNEYFARRVAERTPVAPLYSDAQLVVSTIDWRQKGAVTAVKDQGQCGSCWSFSTTGNIEGQWFLAGHNLTSLSEQEFVSCDTIDDNCQGGLMDNAFQWVIANRNGHIVTEASYPYTSGAGSVAPCADAGKPIGAVITSYHDLPQNESQMATWIQTGGPIAIAVDATSWQSYQGGILTNCISSQLDHGVLAVGIGIQNGVKYWIIKNSWSATWGEQGYIRVAYGSNQCLLTSAPTSSVASKGPAPSPKPTPAPPPTPPTPAGTTFQQLVCQDTNCSQGCQTQSFQQNTCLSVSGGSVFAFCTPTILNVTLYLTGDCTGWSTDASSPLNTCQQDSDGTSFEDLCPSSPNYRAVGAGAARRPRHIFVGTGKKFRLTP